MIYWGGGGVTKSPKSDNVILEQPLILLGWDLERECDVRLPCSICHSVP